MKKKPDPKAAAKRGADLDVERRRRFLASLAGVAGGLAALPMALGRSFLADPPTVVPVKPCDEAVIGTSACTTVVTYPATTITGNGTTSATGTTAFTVPGQTTIYTGTTYVTSPALTQDGTNYTTTVITVNQSWRITTFVTTNVTLTATTTGPFTITYSWPSGSQTLTVTKSWYYTRPCLIAIANTTGVNVVEAEIAPGLRVPKSLVLGHGPSRGRLDVPIIRLGV